MELLKKIGIFAALRIRDLYNCFASKRIRVITPSDCRQLNEVKQRALKRTDFNEHLSTLFCEALAAKPKLIVELGTRGGDSTFVLERVASLCQADFVSVDIVDSSGISDYPRWRFVKADDVPFAAKFPAWCAQERIPSEIDLLFVDTSHQYEHTVKEIQAWFPLLSRRAKVIFHDTNLRILYHRNDRSLDIGWYNRRGVIRALEQHFACKFDEKTTFVDYRDRWLIRHWPNCSGFTVLERVE